MLYPDHATGIDPIGWSGGFAAWEYTPTRQTLLISSDGRTWVKRPLPFPSTRFGGTEVLALGDKLVLVNRRSASERAIRDEFWTSKDGANWQRAGTIDVSAAEAGASTVNEGLVSGNGRLDLFAFVGPVFGTGGASPAGVIGSSTIASTTSVPSGRWVWTTHDAVTWTRHRIQPAGPALILFTGSSAGFAAMNGQRQGTFYTSRDGWHWSRIGRRSAALRQGVSGLAPTHTGLLVTADLTGGTIPRDEWPRLTAWRIDAAGTTRILDLPTTETTDVQASGSTIVITAQGSGRAQIPDQPTIFISTDDGKSFASSSLWPDFAQLYCLSGPAISGRMVVVSIGCVDGQRPELLVAELP